VEVPSHSSGHQGPAVPLAPWPGRQRLRQLWLHCSHAACERDPHSSALCSRIPVRGPGSPFPHPHPSVPNPHGISMPPPPPCTSTSEFSLALLSHVAGWSWTSPITTPLPTAAPTKIVGSRACVDPMASASAISPGAGPCATFRRTSVAFAPQFQG
jgi:hypothetical protein